ncbi:MAG: hypothetical protein RLZZ557_547, partial [Bacteroidota bacterium]
TPVECHWQSIHLKAPATLYLWIFNPFWWVLPKRYEDLHQCGFGLPVPTICECNSERQLQPYQPSCTLEQNYLLVGGTQDRCDLYQYPVFYHIHTVQQPTAEYQLEYKASMAVQARIGSVHCLHRQLLSSTIQCKKQSLGIEIQLLVESLIIV